MCPVWRVLLGAGGGVYLGDQSGDRNHCRFPEANGGAVAAGIPAARGAADDDHRTSNDEGLHFPAKLCRPEAVCDLFRPAEPVPELAFLAE